MSMVFWQHARLRLPGPMSVSLWLQMQSHAAIGGGVYHTDIVQAYAGRFFANGRFY